MESLFNVLIDDPPTSYLAKSGRRYEIQADFRQVFLYLRMLEDKDLDDSSKSLMALRVFFGQEIFRSDASELVEFLGNFLSAGRSDLKRSGQKVFDLLVDSGRIYAAFLQVYRINLRKARVHWWVFRDLLDGLPRGTHLSEVIDIRAKELPKGKSAEAAQARRALIELQRQYSLTNKASDPMTDAFNFLKGIAQ